MGGMRPVGGMGAMRGMGSVGGKGIRRKETALLQRQSDRPPIHPGMLHDDANLAANPAKRIRQLCQSLCGVQNRERLHHDPAARPADSHCTFALGHIDSNGSDLGVAHKQPSKERVINR